MRPLSLILMMLASLAGFGDSAGAIADSTGVGRPRQVQRAAPAPLAHSSDANAFLQCSPDLAILAIVNTYPGGKNAPGVYHAIINQMPPHDVYIEPFAGSAAVLRLKRPAEASIAIDRDEDVAKDLLVKYGDGSGVTVIHGDGIRFLQERRWTGRELVYCDPPYLISARRSPRQLYRCGLEERDHVELLGTLKALPCMVLISGYESSLYLEMLSRERWRLVTFQTMTRGGQSATEYLWCNFPEPVALHDYRFIGKGFRERERIKRRVLRWRAKLIAMSRIERIALAGALADLGEGSRSLIAPPGDTGSRSDVLGPIAVPGDTTRLSEGSCWRNS